MGDQLNLEQTEAELLSLKGKSVIVTVPFAGKASLSLAGELEVVQNTELACGFHLSSSFGSWALIFLPSDVESIQPSVSTAFTKVLNLKKSA